MPQTQEPNPPVSKASLAVLGFLGVIAAWMVTRKFTDDKPQPAPPPPTTTVTETVPTETVPTETVEELPTVEVSEADATRLDLGVTADRSVPGKRRAVIPGGCTADDVTTAIRWSSSAGYAYIGRRCDLVHRWRQEGGDVHQRLCEWGYDSPDWLVEYKEEWAVSIRYFDSGFQVVNVSDQHGFSKDFDFHERMVHYEGLTIESDAVTTIFKAPCWRNHGWSLRGGWRIVSCLDAATGTLTAGACTSARTPTQYDVHLTAYAKEP